MTDKLQQCYDLLRENADFAQYPLAQEVVYLQIVDSVVWGSLFAILLGISFFVLKWIPAMTAETEEDAAGQGVLFWIALVCFFWSGYQFFCQAQSGLQASIAPRTAILEYIEKAESASD